MTVLEKLTHLEKEAEQFGFKWGNTHQIMAHDLKEPKSGQKERYVDMEKEFLG